MGLRCYGQLEPECNIKARLCAFVSEKKNKRLLFGGFVEKNDAC
jgi:hypothetical protein